MSTGVSPQACGLAKARRPGAIRSAAVRGPGRAAQEPHRTTRE